MKELIVEVCRMMGGGHPIREHVHLPAPQPPAQEECPKRFEGGQHRWTEGAPGEPRWCYYCETTEPKPAPAQEEECILESRIAEPCPVHNPAPAPETKTCRTGPLSGWTCLGVNEDGTHDHVYPAPETKGERWRAAACLLCGVSVAETRKQAVEETLREVIDALMRDGPQIATYVVRRIAREKGIEL